MIILNVKLWDFKIKKFEGIICKERNRVFNCLMEIEVLGVLVIVFGFV